MAIDKTQSLLPFEEISKGAEERRRILTFRSDVVRSRSSGKELSVDRVEATDWVNIVALTESDEGPALVMVRQWRFGRNEFCLEVPAGMVDPGEAPKVAALRELREETGYVPVDNDAVECLGACYPNPAFLTNQLWTYFVSAVERRFAPQLDGNEELECIILPVSQVDDAVRNGQIKNALAQVALYLWRLRATNTGSASSIHVG